MARCTVIDMASRADAIIDKLKENGVTTVFRYYASGFQSSLPEKRLTAEESNALLAADLAVGVVFQFHNNVFENMNKTRGRNDATFSLEHARVSIRQPPGSAIYFGVDGDWATANEQKKVKEYFEGINQVFAANASPYRIGVYGSGLTCRNLDSAGLASLFWLPLSTGWSGTRDFYNGGGWTFYQNFHGLRIGGRFTDTNVVNADLGDIGTFDRNGPVLDVHQPAGVIETRRFVKTAGLRLRSGPGTQHSIVGELRRRQNVRVMGQEGEWSQVDIDEDGVAEGFCSTAHLVPLNAMP
jgi:Domain of unknown function (DUF1906)/Bacterial SH3 domain